MVKYVSTYTKGILKKKRSRKDLPYDTCTMSLQGFSDFLFKSICSGYSFELHRQVDAIQMGIHIICLY